MAASGTDIVSAALRFLAARPRSEAELEDKLIGKGYSPHETAAAIAKLKEADYINDERYAKELAASRVRVKRWGPAKIAQDLKRRGINEVLVKKTVDAIKKNQRGTAEEAYRKWARLKKADKLDRAAYARAFRHLSSRGFEADVIAATLSPFCRGADEE